MKSISVKQSCDNHKEIMEKIGQLLYEILQTKQMFSLISLKSVNYNVFNCYVCTRAAILYL